MGGSGEAGIDCLSRGYTIDSSVTTVRVEAARRGTREAPFAVAVPAREATPGSTDGLAGPHTGARCGALQARQAMQRWKGVRHARVPRVAALARPGHQPRAVPAGACASVCFTTRRAHAACSFPG